jgi:FkbM family methyltransferase
MNYAQAQGRHWWMVPSLQRAIGRRRFRLRHQDGPHQYNLNISAADMTHLYVVDEIFRDKVYDLSKVPFTPDVVLDVGANIGMFTLTAAKRWPRAAFVCVEPHPETFSFLCRNLEDNGVRAVKLQCAVDAQEDTGDKAGGAGFAYLQNEGAIIQKIASSGEDENRTLTISLDALLPAERSLNLLLKVDIEGAEVPVLSNLRSVLPPECFIFVEVHDGESSRDWIRRWGSERGFEYFQGRVYEDAIDGYLKRV